MKFSTEIVTKDSVELARMLAESRKKLAELRLKAMSGSLKTVRMIRVARKHIAQILTQTNKSAS